MEDYKEVIQDSEWHGRSSQQFQTVVNLISQKMQHILATMRSEFVQEEEIIRGLSFLTVVNELKAPLWTQYQSACSR